MSDHWIEWLGGVFVVLFGWLGKRLHDQVDQLRTNCISREELQNAIDDMRFERRSMHEENRETLERIHERVDELWSRQR